MDLDTVRLGWSSGLLDFGRFFFWIWTLWFSLDWTWTVFFGLGRWFLDLDLVGFFSRFGFGRFFFQYWILVFFGSGSFWSSFGLDWFGFSSDMDLSVFSRVWISNGIFKKLLK
jgi:hypothetical protein